MTIKERVIMAARLGARAANPVTEACAADAGLSAAVEALRIAKERMTLNSAGVPILRSWDLEDLLRELSQETP